MRLFKKNAPYAFLIMFVFLTLENKGYPKKTSSRYKHFDVSNRVKLFEDCLKDAADVDDSQTLELYLIKRAGEDEATYLWGWDLEQEEHPFHERYSKLGIL